jgi:hypothetical protein
LKKTGEFQNRRAVLSEKDAEKISKQKQMLTKNLSNALEKKIKNFLIRVRLDMVSNSCQLSPVSSSISGGQYRTCKMQKKTDSDFGLSDLAMKENISEFNSEVSPAKRRRGRRPSKRGMKIKH